MTSNDMCLSDAAYAMGALDPRERREFEEHMVGCPQCQRSIRDLTATQAAMSSVDRVHAERLLSLPDDGNPPPVPRHLLTNMTLDRARQRRDRRRTWMGRTAAAVMGAAAAATLVFVTTEPAPDPQVSPSPVAGQTVNFTRTTDNFMISEVDVREQPWGTELHLSAGYDPSDSAAVGQEVVYDLVVVSAGVRYKAGSWTGTVGKPCEVTLATHLPKAQIDRLEIVMMEPTEELLMEAALTA